MVLAAISTHAPAGGATGAWPAGCEHHVYFYSRPCGRGDASAFAPSSSTSPFLLTPLREGRPIQRSLPRTKSIFLLTPLREGRRVSAIVTIPRPFHFYSRPCGRGDFVVASVCPSRMRISTHAPAGGATFAECVMRLPACIVFLLTPLREGRPDGYLCGGHGDRYFYSRPCGRGDQTG